MPSYCSGLEKRLRAGAQRFWCSCPPQAVLDTSEAEGSPHSISQPPKFQGWEGFTTPGAVGGWMLRGQGVGQECFAQVGNNRSKTEFEHKLSPPKAKPCGTRLRNENYAARGFL